MEKAILFNYTKKIHHHIADLLNFNILITWHVTWPNLCVKGEEDVKINIQGKFQPGLGNLAEDIKCEPYFRTDFKPRP